MTERPELQLTSPEHIEIALGNPWSYLQVSLQATEAAHATGRETAHPHTFLLNLNQTLDRAWVMLNLLQRELRARGLPTMTADLRRQARTHVSRLANWVNLSGIQVAASGAISITVPEEVLDATIALAKIGQELKSMWIDVQHVPPPKQSQTSGRVTLSDVEEEADAWSLLPNERVDRIRHACVDLAQSQPDLIKQAGESLAVCLAKRKKDVCATVNHDRGGVTSPAYVLGQELRERIQRWPTAVDVPNVPDQELREFLVMLLVIFEPSLPESVVGIDSMRPWSEWTKKSDDPTGAAAFENRAGILEYACDSAFGNQRKAAWIATFVSAGESVVSELTRRPRVQGLARALEGKDSGTTMSAPQPPALTEEAQVFRDIFLERGAGDALLGPKACAEYTRRTKKGIDDSDFRARVVPALKKWGLKNTPKVGYYFPDDAYARVERKRRG